MPSDITEAVRTKLTELFLSDNELIGLLGEEPLWRTLIPQQYVPDIVEKTGTYILFDVSEAALYPSGESFSDKYGRRSTRAVYSEITVDVWTVTHRRSPTLGGRLRNDIAAQRIKTLLTGNKDLGAAPCHFVGNCIFDTLKREFTGRRLTFKVTVFAENGRCRD